MSRPASKFVGALSTEDQNWLVKTWMEHGTHRVRCRAHAVLLSSQGLSARAIAEIFVIDEDTARGWIDRWLCNGRTGLEDKARPGGPPILTGEEKQLAIEILRQNPSQPRTVICEIQNQTGKSISRSTLRRLARKSRLRWKRARKSVKNLRNPVDFRRAQAELKELAAIRDVSVAYFDEATFSLTAEVPYAWQPIGQRDSIKLSGKRQTIHVLGVENSRSGKTTAYLHRGSIKADTVIACIDDFAKHIRKTTAFVLDNASQHTCKKVAKMAPEWEKRGLVLFPIPAYSPELNHIEHLWKDVKYTKLPISAWSSLTSLCQNLVSIFRKMGRVVMLPSMEQIAPENS